MSEKKTEIAFKILVYSGALDRIEFAKIGFCSSLNISLIDLGFNLLKADDMSNDNESSIGKYFPEIYKHKPNNAVGYWFSQFDTQVRIKIIESEIEKLFDKL